MWFAVHPLCACVFWSVEESSSKSSFSFADRTSGNFSTTLTLMLTDHLQSLQGVLTAGLTKYLNYKDDANSLSIACMKLE